MKDAEKTPEEALLDKVRGREKVFENGWWGVAEKTLDLFNNEKEDPSNPYNVLYSNTEVLKPNLYSATPKPDIRGRFVETPVSPLTRMVERFLVVFSDASNPGFESLDAAMSDAVTSALVPGLGFIRLRYDSKRPMPIYTESGHYKGLIWAAGRKWESLPWIAFRHELTREEFFSQFDIKGEKQQKFGSVNTQESDAEDREKDPLKATVVYEVWVKKTRKVQFLCEDWEDTLVREDEDPFNLQGFYPTPGLLTLTKKPGRLIPTPLYAYYKNQAEELNRVTARLNKVLSAIRVRGAYNPLLGSELERILQDSDMENAFVPAKEAGLLFQNGGFDKNLWLLPIEKLVEVATQLYQARQQIKQVIYEITGLSDILRGASVASETATAQNLKNKWGSIRLRDMQKTTATYVRDLYRLATEIAAEKVPAKEWKTITQAPFPLLVEKQAAMAQLQLDQTLQRPSNPQVQQAAQAPAVEELLKQISSDANRTYTINVQSDSTIDLDTATDKGDVQEFMNAMGQLVTGLQPLAALGPSGLEVGKQILIAVCSRYKFGLSILDALKNLQAPPPPAEDEPSPEQEKKEEELEAQEEQLKQMLTQLEDVKRNIEVQRKEFDAEVKIFKAEQQAQEKIAAANQQVQSAADEAKRAKDESMFHQRRSELQTQTANNRASVKATKQVQDTATPVLNQLSEALSAVVSQVNNLQGVVQELQQAAQRKPKRIRKEGGAFIPEYE